MRRHIEAMVEDCESCPYLQKGHPNDYQGRDYCPMAQKQTKIWSGYSSQEQEEHDLELKNWFENLCPFVKED